MNNADRAALSAIAKQIEELASKIEPLANEETVKALHDLVEIAPVLHDLADGYRMAGKAGNFIKWIAGIGAGLGACWAFIQWLVTGVKV
jgi:sigma54-dependent transcription regulator